MARAPKAGPAVDEEDGGGGHQRCDGHAGDGAGRGADEADYARADGDEEESEDDDEKRGGEVGGPSDECAGDGFEFEKEEHEGDDEGRADEDDTHGEIVFRSDGFGLYGSRAGTHVAEARAECAEDGGQGLDQRDEAGGGDCAGAHGLDVGGPEVAGSHLRDGDLAGIDGSPKFLAEEVDQRHDNEPREDAAGKDDAGDFGSDDVADSEVFGRGIGVDGGTFEDVLGAEVGLVFGSVRPGFEEVSILEEGVDAAEAQAEENAAGERATALAGDEHVGAGGAFGVRQGAMFLHDELATERNHEQNAEPAADQGEHEDTGVFEIEAEKDQRGQGKDDTGGDGLAGVAGGLDNVVLKDGGAAEGAENADGEDCDGNGGGDGEAGTQADIDGHGSKDKSEERAEKNGSEREFGTVLAGRNEGVKVLHRQPPSDCR